MIIKKGKCEILDILPSDKDAKVSEQQKKDASEQLKKLKAQEQKAKLEN